VSAYAEIVDRLTALGLHEEAVSVGILGMEAQRMRRTLDEIAGDAWEDAQIVHVPPRARVVDLRRALYVVEGGRA
jgi:hypothetical protein